MKNHLKSSHFYKNPLTFYKNSHFYKRSSHYSHFYKIPSLFTKSSHFYKIISLLQNHLTFTKSSHSSHFYKIPLLLTFTKTSAFTKSSQFYINPLTTLTYKILLLLQSPSFSLVVIRVLQKLFGL